MKTVVSLCLALVLSGLAMAQDKPAPPTSDDAKLMTPGPEHAVLAKFVGEWKIASKWYSARGAQPMQSHASNSTKWILNGRFLQSDFRGEMMDKPFAGLGLEGYDTFKKKYTMLWIDETSSAMFTAEGTASPDGKTITYLGTRDDPRTGQKDVEVKYVGTIIDDNQHVFRIVENPGTPEEYTSVEMIYTRK